MTLHEILRAKGLSDEAVKSVIGEMKQNKIFTSSEENLDVRYGKLKTDFEALTKQHGESSALIEQLKKDSAGSEDLRQKIAEYEKKIGEMEQELSKERLESALKLALLEAKVTDVDYLAFKVREKGELTLDENGRIKGIDDKIAALKTQYPQHFAADAKKRVDEKKLPGSDEGHEGMTKKELLSKPYSERLQFYNENPELFNEIINS